MKRITRTALTVVLAAGATAGAASPAFAGFGGGQARPTVNSWVWRMPDGSVWGQCADGFHPVWNRVGDPAAADYRMTNGQHPAAAIDDQHMTWAEIMAAREAGAAWAPQTVAFNDLEGRGEVSLGNQPAPNDGLVYEGDCVTDGYTYPVGEYHGDGDQPGKIVPIVDVTRHHDAVTHEVDDTKVVHHDAVPAVTTNVLHPGTPAVTKTVTHPGTPAVTRTVRTPHMVKQTRHTGVWVQVDRYLPRTAAQAATVARLDDDQRLGYREDRPLWGASNVANVYVSDVDAARYGSVLKAVQAKYRQPLLANVTTAKAGGSYLKAWCLANGSTPGLGAWRGGAQTDVDACAAPKPVTVTVQDGEDVKTVVVKPATPARTETVVVTPATPDRWETVVVTPAKPAYDETVVTGHHTVTDHEAYDETARIGADQLPAYEADGWTRSGGVGGSYGG